MQIYKTILIPPNLWRLFLPCLWELICREPSLATGHRCVSHPLRHPKSWMHPEQTSPPLLHCQYRIGSSPCRGFVHRLSARSRTAQAEALPLGNVWSLPLLGLSNALMRRRRLGLALCRLRPCKFSVVGYQIAALYGKVQVYLGNLTE